MTTYEYIEYLLHAKSLEKSDENIFPTDDTLKNVAYEAAQLISGSFTYQFYESLWLNEYPMDAITSNLETLYGKSDFNGFIYFIILLADSADFILPIKFYEMSVQDRAIPQLSAAIIEDWLEYDNEYEEVEEDSAKNNINTLLI